jgi:phosphoglycolate phosphatase
MRIPEPVPFSSQQVRLVLFDLDGTFADTAPDLAYALNQTLKLNGRSPLAFEQIRPQVSHGGMALIRLGFEIEPDDPRFDTYRGQLLDIYLHNLTRGTRLFPGMEELLSELERRAIAWGIVTNKPSWLTDPLMDQLALSERAVCIVSGDTLENRKPHPQPIIHACEVAGASPLESIYVGDAKRDIEAGNNAGLTTLTALFGYIGEEDRTDQWGADGDISHPLQVLDWLKLPRNPG